MATSLPRKTKDSILTAEDWNQLVEAIERADSWQFDTSSGLQAVMSKTGRSVSFIGGDSPLQYMILSQQLPAGDGSTNLGAGKGKIANFSADTAKIKVPTGASDVAVYSLPNIPIKNGATIIVGRIADTWPLSSFTICGNAVHFIRGFCRYMACFSN